MHYVVSAGRQALDYDGGNSTGEDEGDIDRSVGGDAAYGTSGGAAVRCGAQLCTPGGRSP